MDRLRRFLWNPVGWLVFQLVELVAVLWLFAVLAPDGDRRQEGIGWAIFFIVAAILFAINLWIRRRFMPTGGPGDPLGPSGSKTSPTR